MGQWTEKVGKLSLTTGFVMSCLSKVLLKDTARLKGTAHQCGTCDYHSLDASVM